MSHCIIYIKVGFWEEQHLMLNKMHVWLPIWLTALFRGLDPFTAYGLQIICLKKLKLKWNQEPQASVTLLTSHCVRVAAMKKKILDLFLQDKYNGEWERKLFMLCSPLHSCCCFTPIDHSSRPKSAGEMCGYDCNIDTVMICAVWVF